MSADRPFVDFQAVKAQVTLPDVLEVLGIADQFRESRGALVGVCPLPQHQHGPRPNPNQFRMDCKKGLWLYRCYGDCADKPWGGGDVISFAKAILQLSDAHVRFWFAEHFPEGIGSGARKRNGKAARDRPETKEARPVLRTPERAESQGSQPMTLPSEPAALKPLRFQLNLDADAAYLRQRGVTTETAQRFGLGLCRRGMLAGYLAIPVYRHPREPNENPVGYLGRWPGEDYADGDGRPRYRWPTDFPKSRIVYGLAEALDGTAAGEPLVIVEGCFSVYRLVQAGYGAVATFGAALSNEQAALLLATGRPLILMYDGDEAGRSAMHKAVGKLISKAFVRIIPLPNGVQPDSLEDDAIHSLLRQ